MVKQDQVEYLKKVFIDIKNQDVQKQVIIFLEQVATLAQEEQNHFAIKNKLSNKSLIDHIGQKNMTYLARFIKCISQTKSATIKDKMIELVEAISHND